MSRVSQKAAARKREVKRSPGAAAAVEELDTKVAMIQALIPLGLEKVNEELQAEVTRLAGPRYQWGPVHSESPITPSSVARIAPGKGPRSPGLRSFAILVCRCPRRMNGSLMAGKHRAGCPLEQACPSVRFQARTWNSSPTAMITSQHSTCRPPSV